MNIKQLYAENEQLKAQNEELNNIIAQMQDKIDKLLNALYAPKSEKYNQNHIENFLTLPGLEIEKKPEKADTKEEIEIPAHKRKKPGRKPIDENIPRIEVKHDIPEEEKICPCGSYKKCIGQEVTEKLDIIPAQVRVIKNIRFKYACPKCEGTESEKGAVQIAPIPPQMINQSIATAGLLAFIIVSKFVDALPLYRQEKQFQRYGVEISRATMASWIKQVAMACECLVELFLQDIRSGSVAAMDETPIQVLKESGRKNTQKSYMWLIRGGPPEKPILCFKYSPSRAAEVAKELLGDFKGYLQTDGYSGYSIFEKFKNITLVGCMAHIRRKFMEVFKSLKKIKRKSSITVTILDHIKKLYKLEKYAREQGYTYEQIQDLRQQEAKPIMDEIKSILDENAKKVPSKSTLGKAITYALNQWDRMLVYLEDGRIKIDNNLVENSIRPLALGRKNWLFCGHPNGAIASATLMSLIETAKANGHEPYKFLRYLFEELPYAQNEKDLRKLLPFNIDPQDVPEPNMVPKT
jgi:transposase